MTGIPLPPGLSSDNIMSAFEKLMEQAKDPITAFYESTNLPTSFGEARENVNTNFDSATQFLAKNRPDNMFDAFKENRSYFPPVGYPGVNMIPRPPMTPPTGAVPVMGRAIARSAGNAPANVVLSSPKDYSGSVGKHITDGRKASDPDNDNVEVTSDDKEYFGLLKDAENAQTSMNESAVQEENLDDMDPTTAKIMKQIQDEMRELFEVKTQARDEFDQLLSQRQRPDDSVMRSLLNNEMTTDAEKMRAKGFQIDDIEKSIKSYYDHNSKYGTSIDGLTPQYDKTTSRMFLTPKK